MNLSHYTQKLSSLRGIPQTSTLAFVSGIVFASCMGVGLIVFGVPSFAGSLTPPGSPANTFYTLTDLYNLSSGTTTTEGSGGLPATPGTATGTMYTLTEVYSALATQVSAISSTTLATGTVAFGATGTLYKGGMLKTGQAICYTVAGATTTCASTGQDGETQKGTAKSYTDNANGTVTDNQTGLIWQQGTTTTYTWANALTYCNNNTPGLSGTGWRLPNAFELFSLVDFTVSTNAKINLTYFPSTPASSFWSATTYPYTGNQNSAMFVNFNYGNVSASNKTNSNYVRCVRG